MKGFFSNIKIKGRGFLDKKDSCEICGLYKGCKSPQMSFTGQGKKGIFVIAEAPGAEEDSQNKQLIGPAGQLFRKKLRLNNINLDRDCWKMNAINCRPPGNRKPTRKELRCCKSQIDKAIAELNPKYIWLLGGSAIESFFMDKYGSDLSVTRWRNHCIPDFDYNAFIIPMYHPSALLHNKNDKHLESIFDRDLNRIISWVERFESDYFMDWKGIA
jgi:DNA polymerase